MSDKSLNVLQDNLVAAAHEFAAAVALEKQQEQISGINPPVLATLPLNQTLNGLMRQGALTALMDSALVMGNQSMAAKVMGVNRSTLRTYLDRAGITAGRTA